MAGIRTVTVLISPILCDLAELIAGHTNLDVVEELSTRNGLDEQLMALPPNLILIELDRNEGDVIGRSLGRAEPNAKVILLSSAARNANIYCTQLRRIVSPDVSPQALIDYILRC